MRWGELPRAARRYILYHALYSPVFFAWLVFPYLLYLYGLKPLDLGVLYTVTALADIPLRLLVGRVFSTRDLRRGLAVIDIIDAASLGLMFFAEKSVAPFVAAASLLVESMAGPLYPLYFAYEKAVYPEDRVREAMEWHMALPEAVSAASLVALGVLLGPLIDAWTARLTFLAAAVYEAGLAFYVLRVMEPVRLSGGPEGEKAPGLRALFEALKGRLALFTAVYLLYLLAWRFVPLFVVENYVIEVYGGGVLGVCLLQGVMGFAAVVSMFLVDRVPRGGGFRAMEALTLGAAVAVLGFYLAPPFWVLLALAFLLRGVDAAWFVFAREWVFSLIGREEAAVVSSGISAARETLMLGMPLVSGWLAEAVGPSYPYLASGVSLLACVPLIAYAGRRGTESCGGEKKDGAGLEVA